VVKLDNNKLKKYLLIISISMLSLDFLLIFGLNSFSRIVYVVFFYHVSSAWVAYLTFTISLISHIIYLKSKDFKWVSYGKSSIIVGIFFTTVALITGSLWYNATSGGYNNIFWNWGDARQTMTLILLFSYIAYMIFQSMIEGKEKKAKLSSVLGIILFPTIPLSYISSIVFNSLHPIINPNPGGQGYIYWDPIKLFTLFYTLIAITIFCVSIIIELVELERKKDELNKLIYEKMENE